MCKIICVTNRLLCRESFFERIKKIAAAGADAVILREKDLSPEEYEVLADAIYGICRDYNTLFIPHSFMEAAKKTHSEMIHLPFSMLGESFEKEMPFGVSCHSLEDALSAKKAGAGYITAGHIFETDCKKGLAPRGIDFLKDICSCLSIPVYAIGGINPENCALASRAGASGICLMSSLMTCPDPDEYISNIRKKLSE